MRRTQRRLRKARSPPDRSTPREVIGASGATIAQHPPGRAPASASLRPEVTRTMHPMHHRASEDASSGASWPCHARSGQAANRSADRTIGRMPIPAVTFTDERQPNGLRLIIAEDHLAPVVAVDIWYNVGSKNEVPGKTGFAHLFEHVMFQGSAHVGKAEHIALVQAAGGTMNGTTWLDRTNYFETMPSHQLALALCLEADRMGTLLDALSLENLDNQREVVKNEKRWSYDNRPYGSWNEKLQAHLFPPEHPYNHPTIGSMEDLDAATLEDVKEFFRTWYAPNNAVLAIA